jgi:hypothetical protein
MSPDEVVRALGAGNTVSPSGNVRIGDLLPMVPVNSVVRDFKERNNIPIRSQGTQMIFIRDVGSVEDGADIQTGYANLASGLSRERVEGRLALALRRLVSRHMGLRLVLVRFRFLFFLISFLSLRHGDPPVCSLDPPF